MRTTIRSIGSFWLWPGIVAFVLVGLIVAPGGIAATSRLAAHGLCAQTIDHTFHFGDTPLPFDARMTGIYSGAAVTLVYLAVRGRLLAGDLPATRHLTVFVAFGVLMAADGFNSLFTDLGWWHPWESTNVLRVITGYGMGMTLAIALVWLVAGTVFQIARKGTTIRAWRDFGWCLAPLPLLLGVLHLDWYWLYMPVALFLVLGAWIVVSALGGVTVLLATKRDERIVRASQLHLPGALGLVIGVVIMLALALGRAWLERTLDIPSTL